MRDETANSLSSDERIVKTEFVKCSEAKTLSGDERNAKATPASKVLDTEIRQGMVELEGMLK